MANAFYDGDFATAAQQGPDVISYDPELRCNFLRRTMRQRASSFAKLDIGTEIKAGHYLYEETEGRVVGADLIEWDRLAMTLPPTRVVPEGYVHNYQFPIVVDGELVEISIPVTSHIHYSYSHVADPTTITTLHAQRYVKVGSVFYKVGDPNIIADDWFLAEDSALTNLRGNVWEHAKRYVPPFDLTMVT